MSADIEQSEPRDDPQTKVEPSSLGAPSPTTDTTGGETAGKTGDDGAGKVEDFTDKLKRLQAELDATKRQKERADKRDADLAAVKKQREASGPTIDAAQTAHAEWDKQITQHIDAAEQQKLTQRIDEVLTQVELAKEAFGDLRDTKLGEADEAVKQAEQAAAKAQKELADHQKELSQLAAQIKEAEASIGKLRGEVKSSLDARDWSKAFTKNYRLGKAIADAQKLLNPNVRQAELVKALDDAGKKVEDAQEAVKQAKQDLEDTKNLLKAAEQAYKEKQAGLDDAIATFLKWPAQPAQGATPTNTTGAL